MMHQTSRRAKVNVRLVVILVTSVAVLGAGAFAARHIRRRILSARGLAAGETAFEKQDWAAAARHFREYLGRNPEDIGALRKFAEATAAIRPIEVRNSRTAIWAYRQVLRLDPADTRLYEKLAGLCAGIRDHAELAYIAREQLRAAPDHLRAPLWLGEALKALRKPEEAREELRKFIARLKPLTDTHTEYVQACGLMAQMAMDDPTRDGMEAVSEAMDWVNRALEYDPNSAPARVGRAGLFRETADALDIAKPKHRELARKALKRADDLVETDGKDEELVDLLLTASRKDLEQAEDLGTQDPRVRLALSKEWMNCGELDRAAAQLETAASLGPDALSEYFPDLGIWVAARFLQAAELAMLRGEAAKGASLADETLGTLKERWHRVRVLPQAVRVYVAAGRASDGRRCLNEYLDAMHSQMAGLKSSRNIARLQALVARAEDRLYQVIDCLEPAVVSDPSDPELWRLLAEAYSRTDQTRRAVRALIRYLRLRPRDPKMTLQLAREYLKLRDWNRAFDTARLAEPLDPADIVIKLLRIEASIYLAVETRYEIDKARLEALGKELAALRQKHPRRVDIRILQAILAVYRERPDEAEAELRLAIKECDDPLRAEMQLTRHYFRLKRMTDALTVCRAACERHPKLAEPWLSASGLHVAQGMPGEAIGDLQTGRTKVVGRWEERAVTMRLALVEILHGDREAGIRLLKEVAAKDNQEVRARSLLLSLREIRQDKATVGRLIQEMRRAQGESGLLWRMYQASVWLFGEDWRSMQQDITEALQRCIDSDPEWSAPTLLLADLHGKNRLNDPARAEDVCRQALSRNPSAIEVADRLVTLLEDQKRYSEAQEVVKSLDAKSRVRSAWHVRLAIKQGDFSRAIDELKLRASNDDRDATSRILLARLIYWETRNADQAFRYLREAEAVEPGTIALAAAKVMVLKAEKREAEARAIVEERVSKQKSFSAYRMRAAYLKGIKELGPAERDYVKLTTFPEEGARGYELLAGFYADTNRLGETIATLQKGVRAYPTDLSLKRNLMMALFARKADGDRQHATEILTGLERRLPNDPELMTMRAVQLVREATPESIRKARQVLEQVVRLEPTSAAAHRMLIEIAMGQGDNERARDLAIRGLGANPKSVPLVLARARAEHALNNVRLAAELAQMALKKQPDNTDARRVLVTASLRSEDQGLLEQALSLTAKAIAAGPVDEDLQMSRASILAALGRTETAVRELEGYCRTTEGASSVPAILALAELHRARGDLAEATRRMEQAAVLAPDSPAVLRGRVRVLGTQKRFDEVVKAASNCRATAKGPEGAETLVAVASVLGSSEAAAHRREALKFYERAIEIVPGSTEVRLGLAGMAYATGSAGRAEAIYREVLKQDPSNVRALNDLAWILSEHHHDYKVAIELADKGMGLAPENLHLLDTRGVILSNLPGRLEDARRDFEKLVEIVPGDSHVRAKALLRLGRVCLKLRDSAAAKRRFAEAARIDRERDVLSDEERSEIKKVVDG